MNTRFDELTDDDLEQVNGGCTNEAGAEAAGWAAVVWNSVRLPRDGRVLSRYGNSLGG